MSRDVEPNGGMTKAEVAALRVQLTKAATRLQERAEPVVRELHEQRRRKFGLTLDDVVDGLTEEVQRKEDDT